MNAKSAARPIVGYCPAPVARGAKVGSLPQSLIFGGSQLSTIGAAVVELRSRLVTSEDAWPALLKERIKVAVFAATSPEP